VADHNALPLVVLTEQFARLPGIGMKTAERLAYYMISQPEEEVAAFAEALYAAKREIRHCTCCQNLTDQEVCPICTDDTRDHSTICVVEGPKDVTAFERTHEYNGVYHVLHGLISPIDGVMPNQLKIRELLARLQKGDVQEVILAFRCVG
jgi:recombination protein RecR